MTGFAIVAPTGRKKKESHLLQRVGDVVWSRDDRQEAPAEMKMDRVTGELHTHESVV